MYSSTTDLSIVSTPLVCVGRVKLYSSLQFYSISVHESIYIFPTGPSVWLDVLIDNNVNLIILSSVQ